MTRDEVIELAQECMLVGMRPHLDGIYEESLVRFATLVAEREWEEKQNWIDIASAHEEELAALRQQNTTDTKDAERLDWLTFHLSGKALRDIGVVWSEHANAREAIDAAMEATK